MSAATPYTILFEGGPGTVTQFDADELGNKWPQGLRDLLLDGQGSGYQVTTSRAANTDDRSERPFNTAGLDENNGRSFSGKVEFSSGDLINEARKGTTRLTFTAPGAGLNPARYRVGARLRIASEDSEAQDRQTGAMGYPDACTKVEDMKAVVEIDSAGNWLEIDSPLEYDHFTDVRDWPTDWGGTGLPRVLSLDRTSEDGFDGYTYLDNLEVRNFSFLPPANGGRGYFINPTHNFTITNCDVNIYNQFSQILGQCTSTGNTYRKGCEDDKAVGHLVSTNDKFLGEEPSTNGRWKTRLLKGGFFERSNCLAGRRQEYQATTFTSGPVTEMKDGQLVLNADYPARYPQPGHKPVDLLVYRAGLTFASHPDSTAKGHIGDAPHDFYTVTLADETRDLLVPAPAWTPDTAGQPTPGHDFFRTTCEGMCISTVDGSKSGYVTEHRAWDAEGDYYRYKGTWPRFEVDDVLVYSYVRNLVEEGGHTVDARRLFTPDSARFQGNVGTEGSYNFRWTERDLNLAPYGPQNPSTAIPFYAALSQVAVNVTEPAAGHLMLGNYPISTDNSGNSTKPILTINTAIAGQRTLTAAGLAGQQEGDSFDVQALGYLQAANCDRAGNAKLIITGLWANSEAPLD
jgi:hypothetical protein